MKTIKKLKKVSGLKVAAPLTSSKAFFNFPTVHKEKILGGLVAFIFSEIERQQSAFATLLHFKFSMKRFLFLCFPLISILAACTSSRVQELNNEDIKNLDLIAASQTGAKPFLFDPGNPNTEDITPGNFTDPGECIVRAGLPNFFFKAQSGRPLMIGYIGGSITRGENMYRNQSAKFIQKMFPHVKMQAINAGVSGTGTDLGSCRIKDQLLKFNPDLIFIEFAVNGAFRPGMEGMIRQIWKYNPGIDICLVYTIQGQQWKEYARGVIPGNIRGLEDLAVHYRIPSIHMAMEGSKLVLKGKLQWKASSTKDTSQLIFTKDGIHPTKTGGNLYAEAIARGMLKMKTGSVSEKTHTIPPPLLPDNWEDAKMLDPKTTALFSKGWKVIHPLKSDKFRQYAPWFPYIMEAEVPGSSFSFKFNGSMVGLFDIGGPEAGQLSLTVDGKKMWLVRQENTLAWKAVASPPGSALLNRFNKFCNNRYRGQCEFIELPPGVHEITFSISDIKPDKFNILGAGRLEDIKRDPERYNETKEWLGKILIRGKALNEDGRD
jgi:lysophospholipase L1-like esterase